MRIVSRFSAGVVYHLRSSTKVLSIIRVGVVEGTVPWTLIRILGVLIHPLFTPRCSIIELTSFLHGSLHIDGGIIHVLV